MLWYSRFIMLCNTIFFKNWENSEEEQKSLLEKLIHDITNFDYSLNIGRCLCKKTWGNTIICRLLQGIWLHTQNGFTFAKARSRRYPAQMITDYTDDMVLLANTPTQVESQLHSLEQAAGGIGLYVNADKTEFMCFNQKGYISTLNGRSLKLVDKFTYLGSSVSSTENDINTWLAKVWTAIDDYQSYESQTYQIK